MRDMVIESSGKSNNERLLLTLITGLATLIKEKLMSMDEAKNLLFSPSSYEQLKNSGISEDVLHLLLRGRTLKESEEAVSEKFSKQMVNLLDKTFAEFAKTIPPSDPIQRWTKNTSEDRYLPIGSVVRLKTGTKKLMIFGFYQMDTATEVMHDYVGCLYPEGNISKEYTYLFNHDAIEEVISCGYSDDEEEALKARIIDSEKKPSQ